MILLRGVLFGFVVAAIAGAVVVVVIAIGGSHVTLGIIASHYNIALDIVDKPKLYNQKPHNR